LFGGRHTESRKPTLQPAAKRWETQYGDKRPLEVRLAPPRSFHDRVIIIDQMAVWILTQSLNAFATRAPASIIRVDPDTAALKIAAYEEVWTGAQPYE
jgi:hypothetical protein